jgi:hypothetical protein
MIGDFQRQLVLAGGLIALGFAMTGVSARQIGVIPTDRSELVSVGRFRVSTR